MNPTTTDIVLMLQVVRARETIDPLVARGLDAVQIALLLREVETRGLVERQEGRLVVSNAGMDLLGEVAGSGKGDPSRAWIRPMDEHRIEGLDLSDPFLPKVPPNTYDWEGEV